MSIELDLYDFLKERLDLVVDEDNALFGIEVHDTAYREITKEDYLQVSSCLNADLGPLPGSNGVKEFNVVIVLVLGSRIGRTDMQNRAPARERVIANAKAVATLLFQNPTLPGLGGQPRVDYARPLSMPRAWDKTDNSSYALANLLVVVNETEDFNSNKWR